MDKVEVRAVIKYFCKKGLSLKEIHDNFFKTLGDESPFYSTVNEWAAEFKRRRETVELYERSGHLKKATMENLELMQSFKSFWIDILGMLKVFARWVPRMLT